MNLPNKNLDNDNFNKKYWAWNTRFFQWGAIVFAGLILQGLFYLFSHFSEVANVIGYSVLIAYLLIGIVDWIQAKTKTRNRGLVVFSVYSFILFSLIAFALFVIPNLSEQLKSLISHLPIYLKKVESILTTYNLRSIQGDLPFPKIDIAALSTQSKQIFNKVSSQVFENNKVFNGVLSFAFETISFAIGGLATVVISIYLLIDGPNVWKGLMKPLSEEVKSHAEKLRHDLSRCLRGYFIGQLQLSSCSGIFVFIMYSIMGSRYALLLGITQILLEVIPVIGGITGIAIGTVVILFQFGPLKAIVCFVIYMFYTQVIKDNLLTPRVMGDAIGLHPVMVILVVLIGAKLAGVSGVVFALPVAGLLNVIFDYYLEHRIANPEIMKSENSTNSFQKPES